MRGFAPVSAMLGESADRDCTGKALRIFCHSPNGRATEELNKECTRPADTAVT